jgi:tetratricopeptide (TPR) repeat protein
MTSRLFFLLILISISNPVFAQLRYDLQTAYQLIDQGDISATQSYLDRWKAFAPNDIDMHVASFNFHYERAAEHGSDSLFTLALQHLNSAVGIQPQRLDVWLKTIFAMNQRGYYDDQADLMMNLLDASDRYEHQWLWEGNQPLEEGRDVFLMTMHDHLQQWIALERPPTRNIRSVATRLSESFPQDANTKAVIGLSHIQDRDYTRAIPYLLEAIRLDPENGSVYYMLGMSHEELGNVAEAVSAYEKMIEVGNEQMRAFAAEKLEELRN